MAQSPVIVSEVPWHRGSDAAMASGVHRLGSGHLIPDFPVAS